MTAKDRKPFCVAIQTLAVAFGRETDTPLLEAYWIGLKDLELQEVNTASMRALRQCQHMPRVSELRLLAGHLTADERSLKAWDAVLGAISSVGSWQSPDFSDPLTNASVRLMGGWGYLCQMSDKELDFARRNFQAHYRVVCDRTPRPQDCRHLPGRAELENLADSQPVQEPVPVEVDVPPLRLPAAPLPPKVVQLKPKRLGD